MVKKTLEIHSENILPIIKRWLYSDKDIFARELVSNACDAIHKVKILRDQGKTTADDAEFRIDVKIDKEAKTVTFSDNGIGMDAEEVEKYIAQIAFSSAEEFMEKYKTNKEGDQFIGHFGLGFYSAYMIASKVTVNTLSWKDQAVSALWTCDGSRDYELVEGTRKMRGTDITLYVDAENEEYLDATKMRQILEHYCSFMPVPIYLNDSHINHHQPLWIKSPSECTEEDYLAFYRYLYPSDEDPLFWIHLNVDYPFHLKGILYFPKMQRDFEIEKNTIKLYCNRVFVSDNCKDVIPHYLTALRGVIDSPDIPLNVSRSTLQMDRTVRQLSGHISKKVSDALTTLYRNDKEKFMKCWQDVSVVVKLGAMEDEKFYDRVKEILIWKTTGDQWMTAEEYLEKNKEKTSNKVLYTRDEKHLAHIIDVYREKGIDILCANSTLDSYLVQFLERKMSPTVFQRIDGGIDENLIDKSREKSVLDSEGKTEAGRIADFIRSKLTDETVEVEAKSLATDHLPGFVVLDEKQRRMRDYMLSMNPGNMEMGMMLMGKKTFVVNTNNPLIHSIQKLDQINPDLTRDIVKQLYDLALLSQRELDPKTLNDFIVLSNRVLEEFSNLVCKK